MPYDQLIVGPNLDEKLNESIKQVRLVAEPRVVGDVKYKPGLNATTKIKSIEKYMTAEEFMRQTSDSAAAQAMDNTQARRTLTNIIHFEKRNA